MRMRWAAEKWDLFTRKKIGKRNTKLEKKKIVKKQKCNEEKCEIRESNFLCQHENYFSWFSSLFSIFIWIFWREKKN